MKPSSPPKGYPTQAEHWLRILADASPAAIFVYRDTVLFANASATALTGYSESELIGKPVAGFLEPATWAWSWQKSATERTMQVTRRDGEARVIRYTTTTVEMNLEPATLLTAIDITEQRRAEQQLNKIEERLELAQRAARWVTWEWIPDTDELELSSFAKSLFGLNIEDEVASGESFLSLVHPEDRDRLRRATERLVKSDDNLAVEFRCLASDGQVRWLAENGVAVRNGSGRVKRVIGVAHDITEQKVTENALFQERDRAFVTLASIADGVIRTDARGNIDYLNPVAQRLTGWALSESYGQSSREIYEIVDEATGKRALDPVQRCLEEQREVVFLGQRLLVRRDGVRLPVHDSAAPIRDRQGRLTGAILVFRDLTQMRQVEEEIQHLATHDPLTGLINRREFESLIREAFEASEDEKARTALCQLDLDAFKLINDTCGHSAGDQLIRQIGGLVAQQMRPRDHLARLGADEFAILFRDCLPEEARSRVETICECIHDFRFHWDGRTFSSRVSAGLVPLTCAASGPEALLGAVDAACFVAKEAGGGRIHLFQPGDTVIAERYGEMNWISRIQRGLDESRFCLWRQNIVPVCRGQAEPPFSELLIRLIDDEGNVIAPGSFIPAAERYGQIAAIDRWVVKTALGYMAGEGEPEKDSRFAINISGQSLGADGFLDYITEEIQSTGVAPQRVFFEITETSAIANLPKAMRFISVLKEMGCFFVLDDFGQGLSSFGYLKSLPLDFIKIDGTFVREMVEDPVQAALVSSIRDIGRVMGLQTIAESVEDEATFEALVAIGVDYVQGYHLDRPQPLTISSPPPVRSPSSG
jgi:diguanylate cyclase (GGDEF)-like protein/PAS domain S-box-containing protein